MRMVYDYKDYRSFLKNVLAERIVKNPKYSLRAMAKQIGMAPSSLSEVLAGKKNFSSEAALKVAQGLRFSAKERDYLSILVQLETVKSEKVRMDLLEKLATLHPDRTIHNLNLDLFKSISDWYHLAIQNMVDLHGFDFTSMNIAKSLGITKAQADAAIDRLERLELIEKNADGKYVRCLDNILVQSATPNEALRQYHRQMLAKAIDSIDTQSPKEKLIGSENMIFDSENLAKANDIIENCFSELIQLSKKSKKKNTLYHLGIQFFKLTKDTSL
jgi:uncharacterized protein (TIGR02147 family)